MIGDIFKSIEQRKISKMQKQISDLQQQLNTYAHEHEINKKIIDLFAQELDEIKTSQDSKLQLIYHDQEIMFDELKDNIKNIIANNAHFKK